MSHTAFFYGTLMAPPVLHRVIWGSTTPPTPAHAALLHIQPAVLHAHRRHRVRAADYPGIVPVAGDSGACVRGTLVTGLTDGDVWRLDVFEGGEYVRVGVRVRVLRQDKSKTENVEAEEVDAETYIWVAGAHRLEAEEWDFAEFVREKMGRWVGGDAADADEGFRDVDEAVKALGDPTGGRGGGGSISRQLGEGVVN
ncbi:hypothetical protein IQ07DRAFT_616590 [Pyrenochaeta sp. DS3sAY3a]|nr:hypothetical protein IQ07DRAFT_616590 [Pyrenochaeta sp. DS3sAY3a]